MLCASTREEWSGRPVVNGSDTDTVDTCFSDMTSLTTSLPATDSTRPMMSLLFLTPSESPDELVNLYKPFLGWIDPNIGIFECVDNDDVIDDTLEALHFGGTLEMPSLAIIIFLQEEEMIGNDRLSKAKKYFDRPPWKFHHSEWVSAYHIQAYEYNSHDYFLPAEDLPLCSVRQIHCGGEHVRIVRFVTSHNWQDTINLYKLLLGRDPEFVKLDFCVFTLESHAHYDVQFALKKLPRGVVPRQTRRTALNIRVPDVACLAPLLPVTCSHVAGSRWSTRDLDGNQVFLEVAADLPNRVSRQLSKVREAEASQRLSPRVCLLNEEQQSAASRSPRTEHRKRRARTRPKHASKSKFSYSGPGSSFRPIAKNSHQRTDSGFIEGPRHDLLTDIAIDAMNKLGEKGSLFVTNGVPRRPDSPPDSPWESQSSASNSDYAVIERQSRLNQSDHRDPRSFNYNSSEESSPKQESGYFEEADHSDLHSDLESIREYAIDCGDLVPDTNIKSHDLKHNQHKAVAAEKDADSKQKYFTSGSSSGPSIQTTHSEHSVTKASNDKDLSNRHELNTDQNFTNSAEISQSKLEHGINDTKESVGSFLDSLKQREIRRNYPSRGIGAHGTLSADTDDHCDNSQTAASGPCVDKLPVLARCKLPPPPLPPKPVVRASRTTHVSGHSEAQARVIIPESSGGGAKSTFSKQKVAKRVTFRDTLEDCEVEETPSLDTPSLETEVCPDPEAGEQSSQLGFWI